MLTNLLEQVEAIEGELSGVDLSNQMGKYFNAWNDVTANPQDLSLRSLAVEEARSMSRYVNDRRGEFTDLIKQTDDSTRNSVTAANTLLSEIEGLNNSISVTEKGQGPSAGGLRDQRDLLLSELSSYFEISTIEQTSGSVDVFVGSVPLILNGQSRGVELKSEANGDDFITTVVVSDDQSEIDTSAGEIGQQMSFRKTHLQDAIDAIDTFANTMIFETNRLHGQGQGLDGLDQVTGFTRVEDASLALNDPTLDLGFTPTHGSFKLSLTQQSTGQRETTRIDIDLDGINPASDTTLDSLAADINAIAGVTATVLPDGRLKLEADSSDFQISFSDDTSGVLATLGVNAFFSGHDASTMAVNDELVGDPRKVAAGLGHLPGDNRTALGIAGLRDAPIESIDGQSIPQYWNRHVEDFAIRLSQAREQNRADTIVANNLTEQQQAISGVNADEETINLIQYQRMFQASARFINVVDELMQTLINLV